MTVSVTEGALNSQLLLYLASMSDAEEQDHYREKAYMLSYVDDDGNAVTFLLDKNTDDSKLPAGFPDDLYDSVQDLKEQGTTLYETLDALDLFAIDSGTRAVLNANGSGAALTGAAAKIQAAAGYYVKYGILIEDGIPESALEKAQGAKGGLSSVLKPITLQPNKKNVLFKQFFRKICGIQITTSVSGVYPRMKVTSILSKSEQTGDNIWYSPFEISLDFRATDYAVCGKDVQDKIQKMAEVTNPDDVFNISQLALDLQTLSTTISPTIQGFDHDVDSFMMTIIRSYFDRLEKAGQTVFGSVVTVKPSTGVKYLFTPKMRNYHVSPRTLDYLIGFGDEKTIPNLGNDNNLQWDSDSSPLIAANNRNNAAIAISASHFLPFITEMVRPALDCLACKIELSVNDPVWKDGFTLSTSYTLLSGKQDFTTTATPGNPHYVYSYCHTYETKDRHYMWQPPIPGPVASMMLKHEYAVQVTGDPGAYDFGGTTLPAFIFDFKITGWLMIDYNTNKDTTGTYFDQTVRMAVGIRIDSQTGNIEFVKQTTVTDNKPAGLPQSKWVKFMTVQHIQKYVSQLVERLDKIMENIQAYSIDGFNRSVNSHIGFVMPGSKTFTFVYDKPGGIAKAITDSGDLYLYGNYVQEVAE
jgi:hypothetical protein